MSTTHVPSSSPHVPLPPIYILDVVMMSLNAVFFIPGDVLGTERITCESAGERGGHWFLKRVSPSVAEDATLPEYFFALPGLLAVLHGTLYVKQADGDWLRFDQLPERDRQPSAAAMQESSGSSREPTDAGGTPPPIQVIHQCDYSRTPRIRQAAIALVIAYDDLRLRDALDGTGAPQRPDAPAFAQDDPVGSKLSIFVDVSRCPLSRAAYCAFLLLYGAGMSPSHVRAAHRGWRRHWQFPHFTNKQHTVRFKDGQQPISRARLANLIARMLFAYMECHTVLHAGEAISFDRLVLRSVRLASKATLQPEIGVLPAV